MRITTQVSRRFFSQVPPAKAFRHGEIYKRPGIIVDGVPTTVSHNWSRLFHQYDQSHNGLITRKAFAKMMHHIEFDPQTKSATVNELFDSLDKDKDGFIDVEEFAKIALLIQGISKVPLQSPLNA